MHRFTKLNTPILSKINATASARKASTIKSVGVLGAGQMGGGIAQVAAQIAKIPVVVVDKDANKLQSANQLWDKLLKKDVEKGRLTEQDVKDTKSRITTSTNVSDLQNTDIVIEAVTENRELKLSIFRDLSKNLPPNVILATNTSSISITKIAAATNRPEKVVGMHFMNPVPVMKLVEIIPGLQTSNDTLQATLTLASSMGKTTTQSLDMPGFIANRLLMPYINEAVQALHERLGTKEDIDTTMKLGCNMPMGPLTLADFIGLDTCLAIMQELHTQLGEDKYRPSPLLIKYVEAGWLGKKTGRGFYTY